MDVWWWIWALKLVVPAILFLAIYNGGIRRRQRTLERLQQRWAWLGPSEPYQGGGLAWSGEIEGRAVRVTWFEHNTEITIAAAPHAKVGFGRIDQSAALTGVQGGTRVELNGRMGYGPDASTVRAIDAYPGADEALATLLGRGDGSLRAVGADPQGGRVTWFARNLVEPDFAPADARRWVEALLVIAHASEDAGRA